MDRLARIAALALAVLVMTAVPSPAPTAVSPGPVSSPFGSPAPTPPPNKRVTYTYKTFLTPVIGGYYQVDSFEVVFGAMTLTFNPDKTIRGTYEPDFGSPVTLSGAVTGGKNLWLQIGDRRYTGRFTRRGIAVVAGQPTAPLRWRIWAQFVHA